MFNTLRYTVFHQDERGEFYNETAGTLPVIAVIYARGDQLVKLKELQKKQ